MRCERGSSDTAGTLGGGVSHVARELHQVCDGGVTSSRIRAAAADPSCTLATGAAMSHVPTPTTGRPSLSASAISESVPKPPPTAITPSAARTTRPLRSSPIPVAIATETHGLAAVRSGPGRSPTVTPPASLAPRHAAAMTPPSPPQTSTAPPRASARPTSSATASSSASASPAPTTATYGVVAATAGSVTRAPAGDRDHDRGGCGDSERGGNARVVVLSGGADGRGRCAWRWLGLAPACGRRRYRGRSGFSWALGGGGGARES